MIEDNTPEKSVGTSPRNEYFSEARIHAIKSVNNFEELGKIALEVLQEMAEKAHRSIPRKDLGMVLGPMKTGGLGSFDANIKRYNFSLQKIEQENLVLIFNQATKLFQDAIEKLFNDKNKYPDGYKPESLIAGFNKPLLESGLIDKIYLLPNRSDSKGTKLEFEIILKQQIPTEEISEEWFKN